jgi:hypothetical protein
LKVRGRLRGGWLALCLAGAAGCIAVGVYEDPPEPGSHAWWLPLFLFLAALVVVLAVRSLGRGLDADRNGAQNFVTWVSNTCELRRPCA